MSQAILAERIAEVMRRSGRAVTIKEISNHIPDKPETTIRGRLYNNLERRFKRVTRGVYMLIDGAALVVQGDGRDLSILDSSSVDGLVTDHPWRDDKSNSGSNRRFDKTYDQTSFRYTLEDFKEKARVLKPGGFLVEVLPAENENNWKYLYEIKCMAEQVGLRFYAKVPWRKGEFVYNTGRKSKNTEDIMFFTKGRARCLRPDVQRGGLMSGTAFMLPTEFDFAPKAPHLRIHQSEKPVELYEAILEAITLPGEVVVDSFAGSGNLGKAAINRGRIAILFELLKENVTKILDNLAPQHSPALL
ncbi:DNA-methyltransferase [Cohnella soli]|uniref:DNA-methyltransferase n=1 Tax=Cohnella soli TaxID=425005 RepID=A0ABW0HM49_9BACL